ncbi:cupin domain-containing protein [Henriciella sp.]|uniref:cupin domain-containing protein n=1 Tax=Henriciella sp. TaxID=1968823 RepID=UPI0026359936|nr:cupin domain-containing protein [Henriciella sp.]
MKTTFLGLAALGLCACVAAPEAATPPPGSNEMLRSPIASMQGHEVIISDVVIPPGATVPRHYHPGEEFLYVISGSAIHVEQGKPDLELVAGDSYVIAPEAIHSPRGGPDGARAIVFRVHVEGQPERILVDGAEAHHHGDDGPHHHH